MSIDIRLPNITAPTPEGQLVQIRSYLYQFAEQLKWAMSEIESNIAAEKAEAGESAAVAPEVEAYNNFNSIKSLIIKSADIVNAYYEEINKKLSGEYVAQSEFGSFSEKTTQDITANSTFIEQTFANLQEIAGTVDGLEDQVIASNAYIKSGLLYYAEDGSPMYGLEIGQTNTVDSEPTFEKFARFTSGRLSFYDNNDTEVAYISDYKLFITHAEIIGSMTLGGYNVDMADGLVFKWIGGAG